MARRYRLFLCLALAVLGLDQASKIWARDALVGYGHDGYAVISGWFHLRLAYNTGSAFSLFADVRGGPILLTTLGIAALGVIFLLVRKADDSQRAHIAALALLGGGALGNILDRIVFGKVTDFVLWKYQAHEWPVFNVADAALVAGVALMLLRGGTSHAPVAKGA